MSIADGSEVLVSSFESFDLESPTHEYASGVIKLLARMRYWALVEYCAETHKVSDAYLVRKHEKEILNGTYNVLPEMTSNQERFLIIHQEINSMIWKMSEYL